jgi:microcystin-dependent protein
MKYQAPYGILDPNAPYINGDPSQGRPGSIPPAAAFEQPMRELAQCITGCGLTPSDTDLTQMWQALQIGPWINEYGVDTGSANVYSASITPVPTQLYVGMRVAVKIGNANTGPSTFNCNSLGAHAVRRATGADLVSGDLRAGQIAYLVFDGAYWQVINFLGFQSDTTVNNFTLKIPFSTDTGAVNNIVGIFNPHITIMSAGDPFLVKVMNTNTGPVTIKMDGLAAVQLVWPDQSQLTAGQIVTGGLIFCVFDGIKMQLMTVINVGGGGPPAITGGVPGTIDLWPTDVPPSGAYECNGQALSRVTDSRLFGIIGVRYGAPDPNTFKVPDFRGQFIRGWSHGSGVDPDAATRTDRGDGVAGDHVGTKQTSQVQSHTHMFPAGGVTIDFGNPRQGNPATGAYVIDSTVAPPNDKIDLGSLLGMAVKINGTPDLGGINLPDTRGASSVAIANRITGLPITGSLATTGGAETRPVNINMMAIIWR